MILKGDVPSASKPPGGCRFHTRRFYVFDRCRAEEPALRPIEAGQFAACHLHDLPAAQNPMAGDAGALPGEPAQGDIGSGRRGCLNGIVRPADRVPWRAPVCF